MEVQSVEGTMSASPIAEFEAMLNESLVGKVPREGTVIAGRVIGIENSQAIIDVGFKTEGRVNLKEFARPGREVEVKVGEMVDVYLDRIVNSKGEAVRSREKANREAAWDRLEQANNQQEHVEGLIIGRASLLVQNILSQAICGRPQYPAGHGSLLRGGSFHIDSSCGVYSIYSIQEGPICANRHGRMMRKLPGNNDSAKSWENDSNILWLRGANSRYGKMPRHPAVKKQHGSSRQVLTD